MYEVCKSGWCFITQSYQTYRVVAVCGPTAAKQRQTGQAEHQAARAAEAARARGKPSQPLGWDMYVAFMQCFMRHGNAAFRTTSRTCQTHPGQECPVFGEDRAPRRVGLRGNSSGTTCVAWSSMGAKGQLLHESCLPMSTWVFSIKTTTPDYFVHENTSKFNANVLYEFLQDEYPVMFSFILDVRQLGVPMTRRRRTLPEVKWLGPLKHRIKLICLPSLPSLCLPGSLSDFDLTCPFGTPSPTS